MKTNMVGKAPGTAVACRCLVRLFQNEEPKTKKRAGNQMKKHTKRPHIKATARDASAVSIVLDWLKGSAFGDVNSWLKGRP